MILKLPAALARELADVAARLECEVEALALEGLRALCPSAPKRRGRPRQVEDAMPTGPVTPGMASDALCRRCGHSFAVHDFSFPERGRCLADCVCPEFYA